MRDFLFDTPYWALGILVVAAVAVWASGNARQDRKLKRIAYGVLAIAVALALLSYFVDTDKEIVTKGTRELVAAVESRDRAVPERLLHPKVTLLGMDKAWIVERVRTAADQYPLKDVKVTTMNVAPADADLVVTFGVLVNTDARGPLPINWKLVWEKTDQGWRVREIAPLVSDELVGMIKGK